ncbi:MAG: hypothetical protein ACI93T_000904 [Porticoccaceae bacterium]|jgi:hypothetical protein
METGIKQLLLPGRLLLTFGLLLFLFAASQNAAIVGCDPLIAGAILIAGVKISYSIDQFRKAFEDRHAG